MFLESPPPRSEPAPDPLPLAIRAAALGIIAAALLVVLLFRLWALQVLHAGQYSTAAVQSQVRTAVVPARRGDIVDRHGNVLVSSRTAIAVQVNSATFPASTDCSGLNRHDHKQVAEQPGCLTLWRLAGVIKQPFPRVWKEYSTRLAANQGYPITLPFTVTRPQVAYMLERHDRFPSIQFQRTFVRDYPALDQPALGAINPNLIGYVGAITAENLKDPGFRGENLPQTGTAGQAGIEKSYDGWLRGSDGETAQMFDASGNPVRSPYLVREPVTGATVKLTLDANLQKVAQDAIYRGMQIAHADQQYYANYGSVVAINPENGAIYAMASYPTYKPTVWVPPYDGQAKVVDPKNPLFPLVDKSYAGTYPPGSTFKPITAVAAWMSGLIGPGSTRALHHLVPVAERLQPPQVLQLGPRELDHRALEGARDLVRHLLLPARRPVLRPVPDRLEHLPGVDPQARLRRLASCRHPRRRLGPRARPAVEGAQPALRERPQPVDRHPLGAG